MKFEEVKCYFYVVEGGGKGIDEDRKKSLERKVGGRRIVSLHCLYLCNNIFRLPFVNFLVLCPPYPSADFYCIDSSLVRAQCSVQVLFRDVSC